MPRKYSDEPDDKKSSNKKIIRSVKLRKYASVYKSYIRKSEQSKTEKSPRRHRHKNKDIYTTPSNSRRKKEDGEKTHRKSRKKRNDSNTPISKRKSLNPYQKFVKDESKKDKYKKLPGKERLSAIANEWKRINKLTTN